MLSVTNANRTGAEVYYNYDLMKYQEIKLNRFSFTETYLIFLRRNLSNCGPTSLVLKRAKHLPT